MPRRTQPQDEGRTVHRSMIWTDTFEESESLAKIQRWLEMADSALKNKPTSGKKHSA
jgi:hypothetical protein